MGQMFIMVATMAAAPDTIYTMLADADMKFPVIKDEKGDMVVSKLDEKMLQEIARITGGAYIRATKQSIGLDEIVRAINDMEQSELSTVRFEEYNEQFQYLIAIAFALLLVEFWLLDRRNPLLARFNIFREQRTDTDNYNPYNR